MLSLIFYLRFPSYIRG
ncbi:predicted protein [Saccharomyces cerevisiae RM11-1a]|uniref:Uncharacterized protein YJR151W-A n=4 Tax=Saccharomyces cerevisiae TaxID=4932 RepID=YJ151_YEAST|eukprot:NP_878108.1 hypothetical protein YJR151W-A [Saccharomyces cerevisiae S288C]